MNILIFVKFSVFYDLERIVITKYVCMDMLFIIFQVSETVHNKCKLCYFLVPNIPNNSIIFL